MQIVDLPVQKRELLGSANARRIRLAGGIPCNLYGGGRETVSLTTTRDAFADVLKAHSAVVQLTDEDIQQTALIREVVWETFGDYVQHVDLVRVGLDDEVNIRVPFHFHGVPAGGAHGGETHVALQDLEIYAQVRNIPSEFRCDISGLEIGDTIRVADFEFPEGARPVAHADDLIVQVKEPKVVEEETPEGEGEGEGEAPAEAGDETAPSED